MKIKVTIQICILCFAFNGVVFSQQGVTASTNSSYPGNSINLGFAKKFNSNTFHFGLRYHINKNTSDLSITELYKKNYYSSNLINHFGMSFSFDHNIATLGKSFYPFVYYDLHLMHLSLFKPGVYEEIQSDDIMGPVWTIDNYGGFGLKYLISDQIISYLKGGLGISTCLKPPDILLRKNFDTEFASQITLGFCFFFKSAMIN